MEKKRANKSTSTSPKPNEMCDGKWESILHSRLLVNYFKELCESFLPPYKDTNSWMNQRKAKSNKNMIFFLDQLQRLITEEKVDLKTFINEIKKIKNPNLLKVEILWYLEFFRIMTIKEYIQFHENENNVKIIQQIAKQIFDTMLEYKQSQSEIRKKILTCYLKTILKCLKPDSEDRNIFVQIQCDLIISSLKELYAYEDTFVVDRNLDMSCLVELFDHSDFNSDLIKLFFKHILIGLLEGLQQTTKSILKIQENVKNNLKDNKIVEFFKLMFKYCDIDFMIELVQTVLIESSVSYNWNYLFCFITFLGMHYKDGWTHLKTLINTTVKTSLQSLDKKLLFHAFLIARQGCFESNNNLFPSYLHWFSLTFSSESKRPLESKKVCKFFFDFLTELLPYDSTYYTKVHINKVPWVPQDCISILHEYCELAKLHLSDLNVSIELGICENTTNKSAAVHDVENVIKHFQRTNDILKSVFQASMFWKDYYEKKFLVELLSKFEGKKSPRHKLITKLHSLGKIPNSMFKIYKSLETKKK